MQSGAVGYMLKEISAEKMVQAIKTVNQGSTYFCEKVTQNLFTQPITPTQSVKNPLSRREEAVLKLVAKGESSKEIAKGLNISYRTVETHRQNIKHKLDIHSTAELAKYAVNLGLVDWSYAKLHEKCNWITNFAIYAYFLEVFLVFLRQVDILLFEI